MRTLKPQAVVVPVERLWPGSTVVCVGTGPSLTKEQVDFCRGKARMVVVNNAWELAPWADVLYAADARWWRRFGGVPAFTGLKYSIMPNGFGSTHQEFPGIQILNNTGMHGLELDPSGLRTGGNSGAQAIGLAFHLGARQIVLLGYDMTSVGGKDHHFGAHPDNTKPPYALCLQAFSTLVQPLKDVGIEIVNCTGPDSALKCFQTARIQDVLGVVNARSTVQPERSLAVNEDTGMLV